jgi:hypothetical protein
MREEKVLVQARFDAKLPHYWMIGTLLGLAYDAILNQRDLVAGVVGGVATGAAPSAEPAGDEDVLLEIRDSLHRIEGLLARDVERG